MLRLLRLLAFAIVTVLCAGITSPGRGLASPAAGSVAAFDAASAVSRIVAPQAVQRWCDGGAPLQRDDAEAEVVDDTDDDDVDGDARSEIADGSVPVRVWSPRRPPRALRGLPSIDTSHISIADGFPRGPPA